MVCCVPLRPCRLRAGARRRPVSGGCMEALRSGATFLVAVFLAASAAAQTTPSGSLNGTVADNTGALLPGVTVTISGPALQGTQISITNEKGQYRFPLLPPGDYNLMYELSGFGKVVREGIRVGVGFNAEVNVQLQLAALQESVVVRGQSPAIDTQHTNVQNNF